MDCKVRREGLPGIPLFASVGMPVEWAFGERPSDGIGGPPVEDAGTFHVAVDTEPECAWDDGAVFSFTLADMASDLLEGWGSRSGEIDEAHVPAARRLIAELRRVADLLEMKASPSPLSPE